MDWLCLERSGFQSLRVVIGQAKDKSAVGVQRVTPSSISIGEEIGDGEKSTNAMFNCPRTRYEVKANSVLSDMNGTFVFEDNRCVSRSNADIFDVGSDSTHCVYNNIIQDTNWTDIGMKMPQSTTKKAGLLTAMDADNKTSRYAGNVMSLSERLRSIMAMKQASGAPRGDMTQP